MTDIVHDPKYTLNFLSPQEKIETRKMLFEMFKHLTTLDTGVMLITLTILDKFVAHQSRQSFVVVFVFTGISLLLSLIAMLSLIMLPTFTLKQRTIAGLFAAGAIITFIIGMVFLGYLSLQFL